MRLALMFAVLAVSAGVEASERYLYVSSAKDLPVLAINTSGGTIEAPRTEPDQEGFSDAIISPDGMTVGWLAATANCCTSYPLPMVLVIFSDGKVRHRFQEVTAIWHWAYVNDGKAVAYQWSHPHGFVPTYYSLRSLEDGAVLDELTCEIDEEAGEYLVPKEIPAWVFAVVPKAPCSG